MTETSDRTPSHFKDNWWSGAFDPLRHLASQVADFFAPTAEAAGDKDAYEITVELPGVNEKDINITIDNGMLMVSGEKHLEKVEKGKSYFFSERRYGRFQRSFHLPTNADQDTIDATFKDGVLMIRIAKNTPDNNVKTIDVRRV